MKKVFAILGLAFLLILGACSKVDSGSENSDSKKVYELNVSNIQPSTHHYVYNVYEPWTEFVEKETNGRVKVNVYHGGTLGKPTSAFEDTRGGIADIGLVISTYYYDSIFFPYTIGNLPFAFPDSQVGSEIMTKFGEKYAVDAIEEEVHYLGGSYVTDPYNLFSQKPIRKIEDIRGLKMRVQGKSDVPLVEAWGGVPVSIPLDETYEALQKGTLDTAFYSTIGVLGHKYYEVAPNVMKLGTTVTPVTPIMNKEYYESLPEDLQKMFDEVLGPKLAELLSETHKKELDKAYVELDKLIEGKGEIIELAPEEEAKFKASAKTIWDDWVADANAKGYPGDQMMEDFKKMILEEGLQLPF
ncbi:TRAP transporter substrate-binding protein [Saccharococcus sp. Marseille-Q5394]|uniref:TRAP transporter substrate-binding protein n=1 Tax=Saccharococcus sp. Marseille-Q5394 TaxID=2972778 RepID=UPI0021C98211|nr:TRAP transporter substrate-binding protein [Saccharococcus sp. Marseille-Q5394]